MALQTVLLSVILILGGIVGVFLYAVIGFATYYVRLGFTKKNCSMCNPKPKDTEWYMDNYGMVPVCHIEHEVGAGFLGALWPVGGALAAITVIVFGVCWCVWGLVKAVIFVPNNMGKRLGSWVESWVS